MYSVVTCCVCVYVHVVQWISHFDAIYDDCGGSNPTYGLHLRIQVGSTPLHIAAKRGDLPTVRVLLESGKCDVSLSDSVRFSQYIHNSHSDCFSCVHTYVHSSGTVGACVSEYNPVPIAVFSQIHTSQLHVTGTVCTEEEHLISLSLCHFNS